MSEIENKEIQKMQRGRPKKLNSLKKDYNQQYYQLNKEKTKGSCICEVCNKLVSKSNKSRHNLTKLHKINVIEGEEESIC